MGYSQENGYIPVSIDSIMLTFMGKVNEQFGTSYTMETFQGTNFYKFLYSNAQRMHESEIKTSEIFLKLQQYFDYINSRISRPVNTVPGIVEKFKAEGYLASVRKMDDTIAGKIFICVDVDPAAPDFAAAKQAIGQLISEITVGGAVTQGSQVVNIVISNGQDFDYKFETPTRIPIKLRLTITTSDNNQQVIASPEVTKQRLFDNIKAKYQLGKDFEPQTYFTIVDAPWASTILLQYSTNAGVTWNSTVRDSAYDEVLTYGLADIELVEV